MKTVFTNSMTAHVWAQLKQPHGRSSSNSMSFDGSVAYSYREPVAPIVELPNGEKAALFTSKKWSVTTSGHVSDYRCASRQYVQFTVPDLLLGRYHAADADQSAHVANLEWFNREYEKTVAELMRCPCESWRIKDIEPGSYSKILSGLPLENQTRAHSTLAGYYAEMLRYCNTFAIPVPDLPWLADADKVIARRNRLRDDPKRVAKREAGRLAREKTEEKRNAERAEQNRIATMEAAERVALWQGGADVQLRYGDVPHARGDILRLRGDRIETSQGARVPVDDARRALQFIRMQSGELKLAGAISGSNWEHTVSVGNFTIDRVYANGDVKIGCHYIHAAELDAMRAKLGVA